MVAAWSATGGLPVEPMAPFAVLSRRGMLVTGIAVVAGFVGAAPAVGATGELAEQQATMVLEVARAGATYPRPFPDFGEAGPATSRATRARLAERVRNHPGPALGQVRSGADRLIAAGLLGVSAGALLDGLGGLAAKSAPDTDATLVAVVGLAIAVVSRRSDRETDGVATLWLDVVRRRHLRAVAATRDAGAE